MTEVRKTTEDREMHTQTIAKARDAWRQGRLVAQAGSEAAGVASSYVVPDRALDECVVRGLVRVAPCGVVLPDALLRSQGPIEKPDGLPFLRAPVIDAALAAYQGADSVDPWASMRAALQAAFDEATTIADLRVRAYTELDAIERAKHTNT